MKFLRVTKKQILPRRYVATKLPNSSYHGVVGLEVHAQILSNSKLFSFARTGFGDISNSAVAQFDAATPGTLPVLNKRCVESAIKTGIALNCNVARTTMFDRKHYFYADMPAGYQITQQRHPIAKDGYIMFPVLSNNKIKLTKSKIIQIQLEQDSGKSLHDEIDRKSLVDLNRAGMPLLEFVFAPDLNNGLEASSLVKELCLILEKLGISSCKMEEGALRVDANISVHKKESALGVRTEVKNIGSVRGVALAVDYEILRQIELLKNGKAVLNETRNWDALSKKTIKMRDKEVVLDYRFMPEPNLLPLTITDSQKTLIREDLPELPCETRKRLEDQFHLSNVAVMALVEDQNLLQLFEMILTNKDSRPPQLIANILVNSLRAVYNKNKINVKDGPIQADTIGQVVDNLVDETININFVEKILEKAILINGNDVQNIIQENGWQQIVDEVRITQICFQVISENPKLVKQYKAGKDKLFYALTGIIVKFEDGKINMAKATQILKKLLENEQK